MPDEREVLAQQRAIVDAVAALPGVESAAFANNLPLEGLGTNWDDIAVEGRPAIGEALRIFKMVSPGLLKTMGTPLIAGRDLEWVDAEGARPVALVSENLARELWETPDGALGKRIRAAVGPWHEVVGVVADVRNTSVGQAPPTIVYWPSLMADFYAAGDAVRSSVSSRSRCAALAPARRRSRASSSAAVWSVNSSVPLSLIRTMQENYDRSLARTSFTLVMLGIAGAAALVLGVVGLYGVLSYVVSQRRREIAIRIALGAQQGAIRASFVRHGVGLAALGVAIGLAAAAVGARLMASLLYEVRPVDLPTYVTVGAALTIVAAIASYLPARRASRVDPAEALAAE